MGGLNDRKTFGCTTFIVQDADITCWGKHIDIALCVASITETEMKKDEAREYLLDISYKLGTMGVEYLTEKDGEKMREAIKALEQPEQMKRTWDAELLDGKCPYTDKLCYEWECNTCEIEAEEKKSMEELDRAESEELDFIQPKKTVGKLISVDVLDKIRNEIERLHHHPKLDFIKNDEVVGMALDIIDKYRAESEG